MNRKVQKLMLQDMTLCSGQQRPLDQGSPYTLAQYASRSANQLRGKGLRLTLPVHSFPYQPDLLLWPRPGPPIGYW